MLWVQITVIATHLAPTIVAPSAVHATLAMLETDSPAATSTSVLLVIITVTQMLHAQIMTEASAALATLATLETE